jgi:two-component system chemotaxis response regulator CheY
MKDLTVLVIDDFALARHYARQALTELGINNILEAKSGKEGLDMLTHYQQKGKSVQLIISDLNMPDMSGLELLQALRSDKKHFENIPFVLMTVEGDETVIAQAMKLGALDYFVKPSSIPIIAKKLAQILKNLGK